jgi:hypothetical protein
MKSFVPLSRSSNQPLTLAVCLRPPREASFSATVWRSFRVISIDKKIKISDFEDTPILGLLAEGFGPGRLQATRL